MLAARRAPGLHINKGLPLDVVRDTCAEGARVSRKMDGFVLGDNFLALNATKGISMHFDPVVDVIFVDSFGVTLTDRFDHLLCDPESIAFEHQDKIRNVALRYSPQLRQYLEDSEAKESQPECWCPYQPRRKLAQTKHCKLRHPYSFLYLLCAFNDLDKVYLVDDSLIPHQTANPNCSGCREKGKCPCH